MAIRHIGVASIYVRLHFVEQWIKDGDTIYVEHHGENIFQITPVNPDDQMAARVEHMVQKKLKSRPEK